MIERDLAYLAAALMFMGGMALGLWCGYAWGWTGRERKYREPVQHIHSGDVVALHRRLREMRERQRRVRLGGTRESDGGEGPHPKGAA